MGFKAQAATAVGSGPTEIILEIDGLRSNSDGSFTLAGVKPVELGYEDFEALTKSMVDQGIPRNLASRLTEEAHNLIQTSLLADALAQRTRRIG